MICFRAANLFQLCPPLVAEIAPAVGLVVYSIWGLGPTIRLTRKIVFKVLSSIPILAVTFFFLQSGFNVLVFPSST